MSIPVAQYLRMSTEHQRYSFDNQIAAIKNYADTHNFDVTETYFDSAKSGLMLKNRAALRRLIQDVVGRAVKFEAILVYDISRWGRFPDSDESAYYEFMCKASGIPVHYCAEQFTNDLSPINLILKTLKRTMATEYSRELGVRVLAGKLNIIKRGFRVGGTPGYGLRRLLVSADGQPKQILQPGDRKCILSDRVILIPGPSDEVENVREIYTMLIEDGLTTLGIAKEFNRRGILDGGQPWTHRAINGVLSHPKYAGFNVFGKTSRRLGGKLLNKPRSEWFLTPGAFVPIITFRTFLQAQQILMDRTINKSKEDLLQILRSILAREGKLNISILKKAGAPSASSYRTRFGSLNKAYELAGYTPTYRYEFIEKRRRLRALRESLLNRIVTLSRAEIHTVKLDRTHWRSLLKMGETCLVSILIARFLTAHKCAPIWRVDPAKRESEMPTLVARLNTTNEDFLDYFLFPRIGRHHNFDITRNSQWLQKGIPITDLAELPTRLRAMNSETAGV